MAIFHCGDEYDPWKTRPPHIINRFKKEFEFIPRLARLPLSALQKKSSPFVPKSPPSIAKQLRSISKMRFLHLRKAFKNKKKMHVIKLKATT